MQTETERKLDNLRQELIAEAIAKPIQKIIQYDCFLKVGPPGDTNCMPVGALDDDGDWLSGATSVELRRSDCLRVSFPDDTSEDDILRGLRKITEWITTDCMSRIRSREWHS